MWLRILCCLGVNLRNCHSHFKRPTVIFYFSLFHCARFRMLWHHFNRQINAVNCDRVYFVDWTNSCDNGGEDELWTFVLLSVLLFRRCVFGTSSSTLTHCRGRRAREKEKKNRTKDKRQIDGGELALHSTHLVIHFMCTNKCAHKTFQYNVWRSGATYSLFMQIFPLIRAKARKWNTCMWMSILE